MKKLKNKSLYIIQAILLTLTLCMSYYIYQDTKIVKDEIINVDNDLGKKINSLEFQIKKENIKTDSLYKPNLLQLNESVLDLREELSSFKSEKEEVITELYINQIKYWAGIIALLATIITVLGLDFSIGKKVNSVIGEAIKKKKDLIGNIVDEKDWEFKLMQLARIIVVNPNTSDDHKNLPKILKWFGEHGNKDILYQSNLSFENPNDIIEMVKNNKRDNKLNILLLENSDGNWDLGTDTNKNNAKIIASELPEDMMLVYFGPKDAGDFPAWSSDYKKDTDPDLTNARSIINRVSFTNAPSKLYSNIIDTLKYMDIINDKINA